MVRVSVKQLETAGDDKHDRSSPFVVRAPKLHSLHTMAHHAKGWY
jgi:hypothetical protein